MASGAWLASGPTPLAQAIGIPRTGPVRAWSGRLSLTGQFRWASLLILVFAMLGVGAVVSQQAEASALNRRAALTALYVDSALSDQLASLATQPRLSPSEIATLNHLLHEMGVDTGVDLDRLIQVARLAQEILGRELPGQVMKAGPRWQRHAA